MLGLKTTAIKVTFILGVFTHDKYYKYTQNVVL